MLTLFLRLYPVHCNINLMEAPLHLDFYSETRDLINLVTKNMDQISNVCWTVCVGEGDHV